MNGGEDTIPPLDPERTKVRINLSTGVLIGALSALLTVAVMAGSYKNRIETLEKSDDAKNSIIQQHDRQIVELVTTNKAILGHLESIDRKMEARQ